MNEKEFNRNVRILKAVLWLVLAGMVATFALTARAVQPVPDFVRFGTASFDTPIVTAEKIGDMDEATASNGNRIEALNARLEAEAAAFGAFTNAGVAKALVSPDGASTRLSLADDAGRTILEFAPALSRQLPFAIKISFPDGFMFEQSTEGGGSASFWANVGTQETFFGPVIDGKGDRLFYKQGTTSPHLFFPKDESVAYLRLISGEIWMAKFRVSGNRLVLLETAGKAGEGGWARSTGTVRFDGTLAETSLATAYGIEYVQNRADERLDRHVAESKDTNTCAAAGFSLVSGRYSTANGEQSVATGYDATAGGGRSLAHGLHVEASRPQGIALGVEAFANEGNAFVWNGWETGAGYPTYFSHGAGTFNIRPGGENANDPDLAVFIGESTLRSIIDARIRALVIPGALK